MNEARRAAAGDARAGYPGLGGGARRIAARAAFARCVWEAGGERRIPAAAALDRALNQLNAADLEYLTELTPLGPLYLLPTAPFLRALAAQIRACGAKQVLEVAAGDGHLGRSLARIAPDLRIALSDSGAWERPAARMSAREQRLHRRASLAGIALPGDVERLGARAAIRKHRPDLVLCSWLPPGPMLAELIRSPLEYLLEIGAGSGITGDISCWRFAHEFCDGPIETRARCRLDLRPARQLHTRVTLYLGARHQEFAEEKDHWLAR